MIVALVGGDDLLHEMMARDVLFGKRDEADALHARKMRGGFFQSRGFPAGKSICVASPVITAFEP